MANTLKKAGLYGGEFRWGSQGIKIGERVTLTYNSMLVLVANYDANKPEVYFVSSMKKGIEKKLKKLLAKNKRDYYDYICKDFYSKKPKIKWLKFNDADAKRICQGIKLECYDMVGEVFGVTDMECVDFDKKYNDSNGLLKVIGQ